MRESQNPGLRSASATSTVYSDFRNSDLQPILDRLMQLGVSDVTIKPGDHVCAFYRGPAGRDEILTPYIAQGLQNGDKCICFLEVADRRAVMARLRANLPLLTGAICEQLEVLDCTESYLREGQFSPERWLQFLDKLVNAAIHDEGYAVARAAGEVGWALQRTCPAVDDLIAYEAKVNWFAPRYPQILLCFYDLERFGGEIIVDVLKTHPRVVIDNMVIENPYYVTPEELLASRSSNA